MSHTKGPWKVEGYSTLNIISYEKPKGRRVSSLICTNAEDQANARLIAAAPDMLDTLERIVKVANGSIADKVECIAKMAEIAIAKAKGS